MRKIFRSRVRRPKTTELHKPNPDGTCASSVAELVSKALDISDNTTYLYPAFGYKLETATWGGKIISCHDVDIVHVDLDGTVNAWHIDLHEDELGRHWYLTRDGAHLQLTKRTIDYILSCQSSIVSLAKHQSPMGVV